MQIVAGELDQFGMLFLNLNNFITSSERLPCARITSIRFKGTFSAFWL